jgi:type I restriction enzyme M protein
MNNESNDMEGWLWGAACSIRGEIDAPKFKDFILPLIFLKRISDVFDDELNDLYKDKEKAEVLADTDHTLVRF